jgi:hypothetical protein
MQDFNSSTTSAGVLPHRVFLFDVHPIVVDELIKPFVISLLSFK